MFIGQNIKYLRTKNCMTLNDLAKYLGYKSLTTVQKWEVGVAQPPLKKVGEMAKLFKVDIDDFTNKDLQKPLDTNSDAHTNSVRIPVLGDVAAGIPISAIEDILDYEEIPERLARTGEYFGLRIQGDSMEPRICESDVVVVRQQPDADTGDIVIVRIDHERVTCKRLRKYADGALELVSLNPSYEPMFFDRAAVENEPVEIVGVVVENRQKFKAV